MEQFFTTTLGVPESVFTFIILPSLIFLARISDVSINTIRIIYVLGGRRFIATLLGFFESLIWLMAIRQIFEHMDNWLCYVAYPAGFATGIYVGMIIEERIAYGKVIVRIITRRDISHLLQYLNDRNNRFTHVHAHGPDGHENLVFTVMQRENLDALLTKLREILPSAFYTVEKVNRAAEGVNAIPETPRSTIGSWLRSIKRD